MYTNEPKPETIRLVDTRDVIPHGLLKKYADNGGKTNMELPACVFKPDQWTRAFLGGLYNFGEKGGFTDKRVVELGTGCGINLILVNSVYHPTKIYGSDIHPDVPVIAKANIRHTSHQADINRAEIISGGHNLNSWMTDDFTADLIFGCLPQVVAPVQAIPDFTGTGSDASSHYYRPEDYPLASASSHKWGLALNEHALKELSRHIPNDGTVILNLGGRPGKENLLKMFESSGYVPEILHEEFIEQHTGTSIETLVDQEATFPDGETFEFFNEQKVQISATRANEIRKSGGAIFHKIYVIAGTKK